MQSIQVLAVHLFSTCLTGSLNQPIPGWARLRLINSCICIIRDCVDTISAYAAEQIENIGGPLTRQNCCTLHLCTLHCVVNFLLCRWAPKQSTCCVFMGWLDGTCYRRGCGVFSSILRICYVYNNAFTVQVRTRLLPCLELFFTHGLKRSFDLLSLGDRHVWSVILLCFVLNMQLV